MAKVYCEFCGKVASTKIRTPERLIKWTHNVAKDVVRCWGHQRTSKAHSTHRSHDPLAGKEIIREPGTLKRVYATKGQK